MFCNIVEKSVSLQKNNLDMDREKIVRIVKQLTTSERVQFIELLNEYTNLDKIASVVNSVNQDRKIECPHCFGSDIYGHGEYRFVSK